MTDEIKVWMIVFMLGLLLVIVLMAAGFYMELVR
jgi:hypothetical protein